MEGSFVALLLQKHGRSFVSLSVSEPSSPQDFPHLLDLLLSTDNCPPKPSFPLSHGLFRGWSWWRGWTNLSDQETSSSEVYQSGSNDEERIVVSSAGATVASPPLPLSSIQSTTNHPSSSSSPSSLSLSHTTYSTPHKESHSYIYFSTIHSYLDNVLSEVNSLTTSALLSSELLTIVRSLIYTHVVTILDGEDLVQHAHSIDTISSQLSIPIEANDNKQNESVNPSNTHPISSSPSPSNPSSIQTIPDGFADDGISKSVESDPHSVPTSSGCSQTDNSVEEVQSQSSSISSIPCGQYLLVLTDYKCFLLLPCSSPSTLSPISQERQSNQEYQSNQSNQSSQERQSNQSISTEITDDENKSIQTILSTFLPIFTDYEKATNLPDHCDHCDQYQIIKSYDLHDLELMNILVQEEEEHSSSPSQIIHIRFDSEENIFLQVDYAIFVVNEIMKRLTTLH